ncbi:MAG: regulatory protein RecX [Halioglobus sp.]
MTDFDSVYFDEDLAHKDVEEINPADVRLAAMNLLARREHTIRELRQKLKRRFSDVELIDNELIRLTDENLQSDARFAESFVFERSNRGYGLMRVQQEMREKGLSESEISLAVKNAEIDWPAIAQDVYKKKYGDSPASDLNDKAKRVRFMQYRGFDREDYQRFLT